MSDAADATAPGPQRMLAQLWRTHRTTNVERVELLEHVTAGYLAGTVAVADADAARSAAHKLAGSLGTFGFADGTAAARAAEAQLERPEPDVRRLAEAVHALRECLERVMPEAPPDAGTRDDDAPGEGSGGRGPGGVDVAGAVAPGVATDRRQLAVVTSDRDLATGLAVEAAAAGLAAVVCDPTGAWPATVYDGSTEVIVLDLPDLLPAVVAERAAAATSRPPAIVVLGGDDELRDRIAAARGGADAYVWRRTSPRRLVGFVSRIAGSRLPDRISVAVLSPTTAPGSPWRLGTTGPRVTVDTVIRRVDELGALLTDPLPDALIVDDGVAPDDARTVLRVVRGNPAWHFLPVVSIVPVAATPARVDALHAGADDVVRDDIPAAELTVRIEAAVARARRGQGAIELDPLTELPNRDRSEAALDQLLRRAAVDGVAAAVALIDVDAMAEFNARHGEPAGDLVLREFGGLLRRFFRGEDVVGRWGPDEFVVALLDADTASSVDRLRLLFTRFDDLMQRDDALARVTFSTGLAAFPDDGRTASKLISTASARLRVAQRAGGQIVAGGDEQPGTVDVVLVEDDVVIADVVGLALRQRGLSVRVIGDGAAAAEALATGTVRGRLVLLDIGLPGLDGFGVLQVLRERGVLRTTKVIVLTARTTETETLRALGLGAVDHIAKPFSLPILIRRIRSALAG